MEDLEDMLSTGEIGELTDVRVDDFLPIFARFMDELQAGLGGRAGDTSLPVFSLDDSSRSLNSRGDSENSLLSHENNENSIANDLRTLPQDIESEAPSIAYSVGTYSAYGDSPMKPLRESTSSNSIRALEQKEIERLKQKLYQQSTEYDKLLEKLSFTENQLSNSKTTITELERKNRTLRSSNTDLNLELKTISIMKDEIEIKDEEIDKLRNTIVEKEKLQETTWSTIEQLREDVQNLRGQLEDEKDTSNLLRQEIEIKDSEHKRVLSEHNSDQSKYHADFEMKKRELLSIQKDLDRVTRDRDELNVRVQDLECKIEEKGEIIQFTETQCHQSVHQELARDDTYLQSMEDQINQLRQQLDHAQRIENQTKEANQELNDRISQLKSELNLIQSLKNDQKMLRSSSNSTQTEPIVPTEIKTTPTQTLANPISLPNNTQLTTASRLSRSEKLLTILILLIGLLISLIYKRQGPWLEVNCPHQGTIATF